MHEYCLSPKSDEEEQIQNSHALYGRKIGYAYTGILLSNTVLYLFSPLLTKLSYMESNKTNELANKELKSQTGLPYRVNYMIDLDTYYVPIFIHCSICYFIYTVLVAVSDVLYLIVIEHSCGLFVALRFRLEISLVSKVRMTKDKCYSNIIYSIRRHTETIQFVAIVESAYSLALSIQTGLAVLIISFLGYQVINNGQDVNQLVKLIAYLNGTLFTIFFVNWQGQKVIDSSEKVFESAMGDIDQFFQDSHYNIIRLLLSISGLWPFHTRNRRYGIYLAMVLILGSGLIFQILGITEIWHDPFELLDTVPTLFFAVVTISKTFCTIYALPQVFLLAVSDVLYLIVIEHSCGLFVALRYNTEWYSMPIAARKLLIMIMMRSEKPLGLRMGKIVVLSYITFNTVSVIILWYTYV
ncbi:hypothetical protein ALC60_09205 [Trachymyrmex zeteki]|uniref:Odorant receptor n=1 Tax=Mycetomoellerius zeteki TaxID=64791 RepID=A0A151WV83_9HYME|nr:hypothetical protein ALC60_09205 [Trachymyrmex zeteki]